ncbi:MAG TPA: adenylate/guanylate cyclase domain-containing protein [Acidimicrobiales bacterium]|nr:adenylate/guanylate cyclase domain-containing protein [Acidimicrobiales bacterium]
MADLTPYVPRFLLQWEPRFGDTRHEPVEGTLVFADVSGFTRLSERLARAGGKIGAEQMTDVINALFGDLLMVAARRGGEMLKYGGDAVLLFFDGDEHASRGAAACLEMQRRLAEIGRIDTGAGVVRLRMSVGVHTGVFDLFRVGRLHRELVIAGPATTMTCAMEAAAGPGEVLVSAATAAALAPAALGGAKAGGRLLRRVPDAPVIEPEPVPPHPAASEHVAPELGTYLAAGAVEPDHRQASVAFLHLMGLDHRLATLPAASVTDALDETLSTIQQAMHDLGVTFLATDVVADGTKVMASAGAPAAVESADERMVRALLRIRDAATPLPVRAGIHRGHVFAGDVGPAFRRTYTTIGDVTNTAARVMGRAEAGQVLALAPVLEHVAGADVDELPSFVAKGKSVPLVPFLVKAVRAPGTAAAAAGGSGRGSVPFVGRELELEALRAGIATAVGGRGTSIDVVGDAGIGKTRLVDEAAATAARTASFRRLTMRSEPYEQLTPFFAVRHLLRAMLGLGGGDVDVARLAAAFEPEARRHLAPWLPLLGDVFDLAVPPTDATAALEGRFRRQRIARLVEELLEASETRPLFLVFEDVPWLDDASAEVVRHLAIATERHPWTVVRTLRGNVPVAPGGVGARTLEIQPLAADDLRALVDAVTADAPLPPHRVASLIERAGGNPLFLLQLLDAGSGEEDDLPESIEALVAAQVDALPPAQRRLLRTAAVLGASFDARLLGQLDAETADSPAAVGRRLGDLVEPEEGGRFRFRHALLRDVVYEALPFRQRRELHRRAGAALEQDLAAAGEDVSAEASVLSLHFLRAEEHEKAWRYGRVAGDRARAKYANVEAVALYERALTAARRLPATAADERAEVLEHLGDAANLAVLTGRARSAYRDARRLRHGTDPVSYARLCRKEARIVERAGNPDSATRWIRRGLRAIESVTTRKAVAERAALWAMYAWMRQSGGRPKDALRLAEQAVEAGRKARESRTVASAYVILDGAYVALGRHAEARNAAKALKIFERIGAHADHAVTLVSLGTHAHHRGRWQEALDLYARGREGNLHTGNLLDAGFGTMNMAEILVDQGHFDAAEQELRAVERLWRSVGFALGQSIVEWQLGRLRFRAGDPAAGLELLERARDRFAAAGLGPYVLGVETGIVESLLRLGRVDAAAGLVEDALARDLAYGGTSYRSAFHRLHGYVLAANGDAEGAWASMDESLHLARERSAAYDVAQALEGFSVLAAIRGVAWAPNHEDERRQLLDELGVVATPPPPFRVAAGV